MLRLRNVRSSTRASILLLCLICLALVPPAAQAAIEDVGFVLNLSSKEMVLENPGDMMVMKYSIWDDPMLRIAEQNMPFLELTNNSVDNVPITEFRMTIGDTRFNFSDAKLPDYIQLGTSTPGFDLQASTEDNGNLLKVLILDGGLAKGETVRFRVDIDVDADNPDGLFPRQDYRLVFFQSPSLGGDTDLSNSVVTAIFEEGDMTAEASGTLPDYTTPFNNFFNNIIRPYGPMEGVDVFNFAATDTNVIPEPSSIALISLGGLALLLRARRWS